MYKIVGTYLRKKIFGFVFFRQKMRAKTYSSFCFSSLDSTAVADFTRKRILHILSSARDNTSFYRNQTDFSLLPVVDKHIMRKSPGDFTNAKVPFYNKYKFNTGGSTGEPFQFLVTRLCGYMDAYHQVYFHKMIGYKKGDRIFAFDGTPIPESQRKKNIYWKRSSCTDNPYGSYSYSSVYMNTEVISKMLDDLNRKKPAFLRGYPSALSELAKTIVDSGYKLTFRPKGIVLTAENITEWHMHIINQAFQCPVYGQYGHSEACIYAYTEANSLQYKCSPFYGYTEILNDNNEHVSIGEAGRVVVTNFYNDAMYFLRYDTGDWAEYGGTDANGYVILNKILGRTQDFIYNNKDQKLNITALVFGQHFRAFAHIIKWQITQAKSGVIDIKVIRSKDFQEEDESEIADKFQEVGIKANIIYVTEIPLTSRGKFRLVNSFISQ